MLSGNTLKEKRRKVYRGNIPRDSLSCSCVSKEKSGLNRPLSINLEWSEQEVVADPQGQFLIIRGLLKGENWTLVGVYAPQEKKTEFCKSLIKALESYMDDNIILMGNFNAVMDPLPSN